MRIMYVQLESQAFLKDMDFVMMTAAERGAYCTLILLLYCSDGKLEFDPPALERMCNCKNFEKIWEKIGKKFQTREGVIRHKRVTKELRRAKKFMQSQRKSGLSPHFSQIQILSRFFVLGTAGRATPASYVILPPLK